MALIILILSLLTILSAARWVRRTLRQVPRPAWKYSEKEYTNRGAWWAAAALSLMVLGHSVAYWLDVSP